MRNLERELRLLVSKMRDPRRAYSGAFYTVRNLSGAGVPLCVSLFVISLSYLRVIINFVGLMIYGCMILALVAHILAKLADRSIRRKAVQADWFLCPWCRYDLTQCGETGRCPECGNPYEQRVCQQLYKNAYQRFQPEKEKLIESNQAAWRRMIELREGIAKPEDKVTSA